MILNDLLKWSTWVRHSFSKITWICYFRVKLSWILMFRIWYLRRWKLWRKNFLLHVAWLLIIWNFPNPGWFPLFWRQRNQWLLNNGCLKTMPNFFNRTGRNTVLTQVQPKPILWIYSWVFSDWNLQHSHIWLCCVSWFNIRQNI